MNNTLYLAIQHTYNDVQLGLYNDNNCIEMVSIHKHHASSILVDEIKQLLIRHQKKLNDLTFIAVNQGPGPFTTLRVVIATVNGVGFALGIPIVGIDGIKSLINATNKHSHAIHIALLNAFNQDVYFAIKKDNNSINTGYNNILLLLEELYTTSNGKEIYCIGNAASLHKDLILEKFPHAIIDTELTYCPLNALAQQGLYQWKQKIGIVRQLQPLYLKNVVYSMQLKNN